MSKLGKALIKGLKEATEWHDRNPTTWVWYCPENDDIIIYPTKNGLGEGMLVNYPRVVWSYFSFGMAEKLGYVKIGEL